MRTVSFQGIQLSASQRRTMAMRQQVQQAFMSAPLQEQVQQTIQVLDERKEQGAKPERVWFPVSNESGTPWLGDVFGF